MTQIGEGATIPGSDSSDDKCPFCDKAPHDFPSRRDDPNQKIVSKPRGLGDLPLAGQAPGRWGRARHHIIPAIQCFARVRRMARMALSAGYDINAPANGIGLPTVRNKYSWGGRVLKFGEFADPDKEAIAFWVMEQTGKQWHVGAHHYQMPSRETETDELDDEGEIDHLPYDEEVIKRLVMEMDQWAQCDICESEDDMSEEMKQCMKRISDEIRTKLRNFEYEPRKSVPYYVSRMALDFSKR